MNRKMNKSLWAASVIAAAVWAAPVAWAGTSQNLVAGPLSTNGGNPAVTISLSGSTATRNWTVSEGPTLLTTGTSMWLNNGAGGAPVSYTNSGTSLQLAPYNFTAPDSAASQSAIRLEWHEQGSVEGILDLVNDQIGYIGAPITAGAIRNASVGNPIWVNGRVAGTPANTNRFLVAPGTSNGLSLAVSDYNTYNPATYNLATGQNLVGGQNRVQLAISDVNAVEGFAVLGTGSVSSKPATAGFGQGNTLLGTPTVQLSSTGFTKPGARYQMTAQETLNMETAKVDPQTGVNYPVGPWNSAGTGNLQNVVVGNTAMLLAANPGTGLERLTKSDAQWLQTTGRLANGADFNVAARDLNSGTRVSTANNTGVDPSFAVGENDEGNGQSLLAGFDAKNQASIGPALRFSNKTSGGSQLRPTIQNNRMSLGTLSLSDGRSSTLANTGSSPLRALDYAADGVNFVRCSATSITGGGTGSGNNTDPAYALWTNQTFVTVKAPTAAYAGNTVAQWSALAGKTVSVAATPIAQPTYTAGPAIKGDNTGNDVVDFQNNITSAVATFPPPTVANPADALLSNGFILPQMMAQYKQFDGDTTVDRTGYSASLRTALLGSGYATNFNVGDPTTVTKGNNAVYGNGAGSNLGAFSGDAIPITDLGAGKGNWLFGNFNQNGIRDFSAIKQALPAVRALTATGNNGVTGIAGSNSTAVTTGVTALDTMNTGSTPATRGDLIVLGDYNGDGKFDGQDVFTMAHGAALSDAAAAGYAAGTLSSRDAVRTGLLRKNDALDYFDSSLGSAAGSTDLTIRQAARVVLSAAVVPTGATNLGADAAHPGQTLFTWDANGVNAFNKRDVNRDGKTDLNDAFILAKFAGQDYTNQTQALAATINADGSINHTTGAADQIPYNLVDAKLVDPTPTAPGTAIVQADMDQLNGSTKGLKSTFSHTWNDVATPLKIVAEPQAGSVFTVPAVSGATPTLTVTGGGFTAGGTVDPFTDNTGGATNGNHVNVAIAPGQTLAVTAGTKNLGSLATLAGAGNLNVQVDTGAILQTNGALTATAGQAIVKTGTGNLNVLKGLSLPRTSGIDVQAGTMQIVNDGTDPVTVGSLASTSTGATPATGAINIADGATLQTQGVIQRTLTLGATKTGRLQAIGSMAVVNFTGAADVAGQLDAQSNLVQVVSPVRSEINSITLANGGQVSSGGGIIMPTKQPGTAAGTTGQITLASGASATIGGNFQGGKVSGDAISVRGVLGGPIETLTFTGVVKGAVNATYANVTYTGSNQPGFSPVFVKTLAATATYAGTTEVSFDSAVAYVPDIASTLTSGELQATGGGYYTMLIAGVNVDGVDYPSYGDFAAGAKFKWKSDSTFNAASAHGGEVFEIVRTDAHLWGTDPSVGTYIDGSLINYGNITLGSFDALPTLPVGMTWAVDATSSHIALEIVAVPEPAAAMVLMFGVGALAMRVRRRRA